MRYINILAIGGNAHVLQSVTAICQLDVLYFGKAPHINNRDTGCHYIQGLPAAQARSLQQTYIVRPY